MPASALVAKCFVTRSHPNGSDKDDEDQWVAQLLDAHCLERPNSSMSRAPQRLESAAAPCAPCPACWAAH